MPKKPPLASVCLLVAAVAALSTVPGCQTAGDGRHPDASGDAVADIRNPELHSRARVTAVGDLWRDVEAGVIDRSVARDTLKAVAWPKNNPEAVRLEALRVLYSDRQGDDDSRALTRLMLPHSGGVDDVSVLLAMTAAERGWTDCVPAIVRSYSRFDVNIADEDRVERRALEMLYPGQPVAETVYGVFLDPQTEPGPETIRFDDRTRADAWNLLARLDPTGEARASLILDTPSSNVAASSRPMLEALRAALRDFRVVPITGDELQWLAQAHQQQAAWWGESRNAVTRLQASERLTFRHLEPIRWAAANRPEWLTVSRDEHLSVLAAIQREGSVVRRRADRGPGGGRRGELVEAWSDTLSWADALTARVVREAIQDRYVLGQIAQQAKLDRDDTTTEYGGVLEAVSNRGFDAVLFPPRPSQRVNDTTFVASQDMIDGSATALAHYHLHAQRARNSEYAGPSLGDLQYAARSGRTCVVFTTIDNNTVNADLYAPDGSVLDLGVLELPSS